MGHEHEGHHPHCTDENCQHEEHRHSQHSHDPGVTSVAIEQEGSLDPSATNEWLGKLLQSKGPDLYRSKGILNFAGEEHRWSPGHVTVHLLRSLEHPERMGSH